MRQRLATEWWANPENKEKIEKRNKKVAKANQKQAKNINWHKFAEDSWKIRKKKYGETGLKNPEEFGKKISKALTGKKQPKAVIEKRAKAIKKNHWAKNPIKRKATGKKISIALTGIKRSEKTKEKIRQENFKHPRRYWLDKKRSKDTKEKISKNRTGQCLGKNNPAWNDGSSFEPYGAEFNKRLKEQIRARDKFACQQCRKKEKTLDYILICHHIDYNKKNNDPTNLISLCKTCHSQTNFSREDRTKYFQEKLTGDEKWM